MATPINRLLAGGTVESLEVQIPGKKHVLYGTCFDSLAAGALYLQENA